MTKTVGSILVRNDVAVAVRVESQVLGDNPPLSSKACVVVLSVAAEAFCVALAAVLILVGKLSLGAGRELYSCTRMGGG